jgi:hypothetical protein
MRVWRWIFGIVALLVGTLLFAPLNHGQSLSSNVGICGSGLGQFAQGLSFATASQCATDGLVDFFLAVTFWGSVVGAVLCQIAVIRRQKVSP